MNFLLFWIKVAARRFIFLFKTSPVVVIGAIIIFTVFIIARNEIFVRLNTQTLIFAILFFVFVSLLLSFKKYSTKRLLIIYSKSKFGNKIINILFFIKKAFINNILLFIFIIVVLKDVLNVGNTLIISAATVCSLVLSLLLMYLKNEYTGKRVRKISVQRLKFNSVIKSTVYDYFTSDFLQTALVSTVLFIAIIIEIIRTVSPYFTLENPSILLIGMAVILSIGFIGIIDSVSRINWKYFSLVSPKNYSYHFKRSAFFLAAFFSLLIVVFIIIAAFSGAAFLLKYLFCLLVMFLLSINISFTNSGVFYKALMFLLAIALIVWISTLHIVFLPVLAVPVLIVFIKAKNEYREWYYL